MALKLLAHPTTQLKSDMSLQGGQNAKGIHWCKYKMTLVLCHICALVYLMSRPKQEILLLGNCMTQFNLKMTEAHSIDQLHD